MVEETTVTVEGPDGPTEVTISPFGKKVYVKHNGSQYCVKKETIFKSFLKVNTDGGITLDLQKPLSPEALARDREVTPTYSVTRTVQSQDAHPAHLEVLHEVATTIENPKESEYWNGYKDGKRCSWEDIVYKEFFETWDGNKELMEAVGKWFAEEWLVPCNQTNVLFPIGEWATANGGGYVNTIRASKAHECSQCGKDLSDTRTVTRKSGNNARKATKYMCDPDKGGCGNRFKGITTG